MQHPCYTGMNPAADAHRYTSEKVQVRKMTLVYDWLDPGRDIESWFRRVPYRLERGAKNRSWVIRYFEFRAKTLPVSQMGFIGDLWICWCDEDPSVWFKVDGAIWERWGGCASSVREVSFLPGTYPGFWGPFSIFSFFFRRCQQQMNAKHPFLDKAYLWFDPIDHFFPKGGRSDKRLSLRWERLRTIRRIAPINRIVDPDCALPPRKAKLTPVRLPNMRTIVGAICPNMPGLASAPLRSMPTTSGVDRRHEGHRGHGPVAGTSGAQAGGSHGPPPPNEELGIGSDAEFDWDWWGSSTFDFQLSLSFVFSDAICS